MINKIWKYIKWRISYTLRILFPQILLSLLLPKKILSGPFRGMKYLNKSTGSVILPKLIGTYEDELHPIINDIRKNEYKNFIDIGAAEGYYVIGIKKYILPKVQKVTAFETTLRGRRLIRKLADLNNVDNIEIKGFCDRKLLSNALTNEKTLIIVDIEGGEYNLLNPREINFNYCDLLIELHDMQEIDGLLEFQKRFQHTHAIVTIKKGAKILPAISLPQFIKRYATYSMNEFRGNQNWLFLKYANNE